MTRRYVSWLAGGLVLATPAAEPAHVLVGAGDIAACGRAGDEATARLLDRIPGTVFTAGDNAYERGTRAEFRRCYAPSWGRHRARTRPALGNHEYLTRGAAGHFSYFGAAAGPRPGGYYAYDLGSWRVYVLNSNCMHVPCGRGSAQERWLRADLAANPRPCSLAYWHHPRFSSGVHGGTRLVSALWQALHDHAAEVVVTAHDHDYERFEPLDAAGRPTPTGLRSFVVGTGGRSLRSFRSVRQSSAIRSASAYGVLKLELAESSYTWEFVPVAGKTFRDAGSAGCR